MGELITTATSLRNGVTKVTPTAQTTRFSVLGNWTLADTYNVVLTNVVANLSESIGYGPVTGKIPTFSWTYKNKLNVVYDVTWAFSANNEPTKFNDPNGFGNGRIDLSDSHSEFTDLIAGVPYQGRVAVFGTDGIQIWEVGSDPASYRLLQVLENIGSIAKESVKSLGELDVFFLHTSGVRSLRVRDSSLNAQVVDIGSPIDALVTTKLLASTAAERAAACGIFEPKNNQYWLFIKDTIYVLSYFPSAKITAWAEWKPTYQSAATTGVTIVNNSGETITYKLGTVFSIDGSTAFTSVTLVHGASTIWGPSSEYIWIYDSDEALQEIHTISTGMLFTGTITVGATFECIEVPNQVAFTPQKFVRHDQRVIASASDAFYLYGGADRGTYDNSVAAMETSWLDADTPANEKQMFGIDSAQSGYWFHFGSADFRSEMMQVVIAPAEVATFAGGKIDWMASGTHFKYRMVTTGRAEKATISNLLLHYRQTGQK